MSYASLMETDQYAIYHKYSASWAPVSGEAKLQLLDRATRAIDRLAYSGCKASSGQVNAFPRRGQNTVPQEIIEACMEIALAYADGVDANQEFLALNLTTHAVGSIREERNVNMSPRMLACGIPSYEAWVLLEPFLENRTSFALRRAT